MTKGRLEAFSDGVIAVIITILVLHMFHVVHHINGDILWANSHLLFWLSLVPFVTAWMGENHFAPVPVAVYGLVLVGAAAAYSVLARALLRIHPRDSLLAKGVGSDRKGKLSLIIYLAAVALAFVSQWIACALYVLVAAMWLCPDPRLEKLIAQTKA